MKKADVSKDWADIVGMPDAEDKQNLTNLINTFKSTKFTFKDGSSVMGRDWIRAAQQGAARDHQLETLGQNDFGVKIKDSEMRTGAAIPNVLWAKIQEAYPTMFRDRRHHDWFMRNFPEFRIAKRY